MLRLFASEVVVVGWSFLPSCVCFSLQNMKGYVTEEEVIETVEKIYAERAFLAQAMRDRREYEK